MFLSSYFATFIIIIVWLTRENDKFSFRSQSQLSSKTWKLSRHHIRTQPSFPTLPPTKKREKSCQEISIWENRIFLTNDFNETGIFCIPTFRGVQAKECLFDEFDIETRELGFCARHFLPSLERINHNLRIGFDFRFSSELCESFD